VDLPASILLYLSKKVGLPMGWSYEEFKNTPVSLVVKIAEAIDA
jgi:hypothetical protein